LLLTPGAAAELWAPGVLDWWIHGRRLRGGEALKKPPFATAEVPITVGISGMAA
jgi:hypothetical protein